MRPAFLDKSTKPKPKTRSKSRSKAKHKSRKPRNSSPRRRVRADTTSTTESPRSSPSLLSLLIRYTSIILILLLGTGTLLYIKRDKWGVASFIKEHLSQFTDSVPEPKPDPDKYASIVAQLDSERANFKARFLSAETAKEQEDIINEASVLLEDRLPSLMRCWLGHPWDFNGMATVPGRLLGGSILDMGVHN